MKLNKDFNMNSLTNEQNKEVTKLAQAIVNKEFMFDDYNVKPIWDYTQTHCVTGIGDSWRLGVIKKALKEKGAYKFRQVKNSFGRYTLCFDGTKMLNNLEK
jgi:hypothetical protein